MQPLIAPSMLSADFSCLEKDIQMVNQSQADFFHLDIMDGIFVPNLSFGLPIVNAVKRLAQNPLDVHLMIVEPDKYIKAFKKAGADILTVHYEACTHLHRTLHAIKEENMKAGVAINPHTPVSVLSEIITEVDWVCIMSVNPGFGGQKFIENTYAKVKSLKQLIADKNANVTIEVDGGVTLENAKKLVECGTDVLVAGNFVFSSAEPSKTIYNLKYCYDRFF